MKYRDKSYVNALQWCIGLELFQKIVAGAAVDAGRDARIVRRLAGAADHPVALNFPEGEYLKGLLVQVD